MMTIDMSMTLKLCILYIETILIVLKFQICLDEDVLAAH